MSEATESVLEAILRGDAPAAAPSRREFPRYSAAYPIELELDRGAHSTAGGVTINLARSGMLARVERPVATGTRCTITFLSLEQYRPEMVECPCCGSRFPILELPDDPVRGTVVRAERGDDDSYLVAVMFEEPLGAVSA